jgi:hypothetical protein
MKTTKSKKKKLKLTDDVLALAWPQKKHLTKIEAEYSYCGFLALVASLDFKKNFIDKISS